MQVNSTIVLIASAAGPTIGVGIDTLATATGYSPFVYFFMFLGAALAAFWQLKSGKSAEDIVFTVLLGGASAFLFTDFARAYMIEHVETGATISAAAVGFTLALLVPLLFGPLLARVSSVAEGKKHDK